MSAVICDIYIYPPPLLLMVIHHCDVWLIGCCQSISPNLKVPHDFYLFILHHLWRNPYRSCNVLSSASTVVYWGRPLPLSILIGTSVSSQYQQRVFLYVVDAMILRCVLREVPFSMTSFAADRILQPSWSTKPKVLDLMWFPSLPLLLTRL